MNAQPTENSTPIAEYLSAVATSDLIDGHVAPKEEATHRIEAEISRKCGCTSEPLAVDHAMGRTQQLDRSTISAKPETFVKETIAAIDRIAATLSEKHAKKFDIAFRNLDCEPNLWRDTITIGVRYMT